MRLLTAAAALSALAACSAARADIAVPNGVNDGIALDTILKSDGARQYQEYLGRDLFPQQSLPILVTGIQVRLPSTTMAPWPVNDTTFFNYQIVLAEASNALIVSGGVFDPTPGNSFANNMVNPVTVYNGPLTIPAGSYVGGSSAPVISFNVSNYILQPGKYMIVYVSHSVSDQMAGTFTPGFETASGSTLLGFASAVYVRDQISANFTNSADPYFINFVSAPITTNISTRASVGIGANVTIGGFIISGPTPKTVVIRALGPSLTQFGVANALANPQLALFQGATQIDFNDDWGTLSAADQQTLINNNLAPGFPTESALVKTLQPGAYTAQVIGANMTTGAALVEVYDVDSLSPTTLTNISTRASVGTGSDVTIAGFIVENDDSVILIRGIGPSLAQFNIPNVLADPFLELHNEAGTIITQNNNWQTQAPGNGTPQQIIATGLAPSFGKESAILLTLKAGKYTCILTGVNNTTGVGRIDVFQISQ